MPLHRSSVRRYLEGPGLRPSSLTAVFLMREEDSEGVGPMPTVTVREIPQRIRELEGAGIRSVKVFAGSRLRDSNASQGAAPTGLMMRAIRAVKGTAAAMAVMTETCLCSHTDSGECFVRRTPGGDIDMRVSCEAIAEQAVAQAVEGADIVGPAAMLPGSVRAVRQALDESGHSDVAIMPHVIFASSLYAGYRATMRAVPASGSRPFQISPVRPEQAVSTGLDYLREGADMLLLEPALASVDTLVRLKAVAPSVPLVPFSVSGEYLRLAVAGEDGKRDTGVLGEAYTMMARSGADGIITYGALDLARSLTAG
ncbi:hypothetical protein [Streptomyces tsukubensis]|uniref:Delta-aminolevulinic acid dehydratase n=1 Tax=Streptomyces tsukubensis TaxID=83656 RepID=A0A1V4A4K0_9ACTN|nr:hypothetical protein [Streptomyces tsukubensis]OON75632.1 hypothetical protein B1H18_22535 [Streptomyces tsukubensis]QFR94386.1 hypothetical protein GBW32_16665 [Streptomyces tsukubensis]